MSEDLHDYDEKRVDALIVGDIVQDLGIIEEIEKDSPVGAQRGHGTRVDRFEVDMFSPSRGGTTRRWRGDHRVKVRVG